MESASADEESSVVTTALPIKPIVSDMTVSSKEENESKGGDESRDDNTLHNHRDGGDGASNSSEREGGLVVVDHGSSQQHHLSASKSGKALPSSRNNTSVVKLEGGGGGGGGGPSAFASMGPGGGNGNGGRYLYPSNNNNGNNNMGQQRPNGPFPMGARAGPPYPGAGPHGPPPYYHGSSYGPSGPHPGHLGPPHGHPHAQYHQAGPHPSHGHPQQHHHHPMMPAPPYGGGGYCSMQQQAAAAARNIGNYPPPPHHIPYGAGHGGVPPQHGGGGGGPPPYSMPPYGHHGMQPYNPMHNMSNNNNNGMPNNNNNNNNSMNTSDSTSISSSRSKGSRNSNNANKKRTIDGVHNNNSHTGASGSNIVNASSTSVATIQSAYAFRRTDSNSSTTSATVMNTSGDATTIGESPSKRERSGETSGPVFEDHHHPHQNHHHHSNSQQRRRGGHPAATSSGEKQGQSSSKQHHHHHHHQNSNSKGRYHRRDYSGTSTASSLSVGGFSLSSYDGPRVGAIEDGMATDPPLLTSSPKRRKASTTLLVDTEMRPESAASHNSIDADQSTRFEQLSIDASKLPASTSSSESSASEQDRNLFLSLSTSPINHDVDATPVSKNTKQTKIKEENIKSKVVGVIDQNKASIFKPKGMPTPQPKIETCTSSGDHSRPSDTPTPPVHREMSSSMTEDHTMLTTHLRHQSFTPLPHLSTNESSTSNNSPTGGAGGGAAFAASIAPQLSWSIAGDTPSLGDLADWDEDHKLNHNNSSSNKNNNNKTEQKERPNSTSSSDMRNMMISPHDFQFWKEEQEMADNAISGTTTPLPVFFEQSMAGEGTENHNIRFDHNNNNNTARKPGEMEQHPMHHNMFMSNGGRSHGPPGLKHSNKPMPPHPVWSKHHDPSADKMALGMPPTPMFANMDFRDDGFGRSPMGGDRRDMDFYPTYPGHPGPPGPNDRVRNLRGRVPPGHHMPPMPLHIPPPMSAHLPMTSPMGLGPKAGLWSPHHHAGMPPPLASPHHMGSPLSNMAQSKRKCVPLKPPIPSKFQGDIDKAKTAPVPEFTSLVNFPGHMSQKQSVNLPEGMRCCVMCGQACPCSTGNKSKKCKKQSDGSLVPRCSNGQEQQQLGDKNSGYAIIPTQNKGLCTLCDVNVWVVVTSGLEIKWCKGCKNFRPWAAFGDKGLATKCLRCRERQREKYALQKEEKEKARITAKPKK